MSLFLLETTTGVSEPKDVDEVVEALRSAVGRVGAQVVEARLTADAKRLFTIVEHDGDPDRLRADLRAEDVEVDEVAAVRLVGAELDEVKAAADQGPQYLVEWDLPSDLTMDRYLARKKEKSPLYAEIPEVTFHRTYVREDLDKCLCFYDAPCVDDVYRAREIVSAPVDRLTELR